MLLNIFIDNTTWSYYQVMRNSVVMTTQGTIRQLHVGFSKTCTQSYLLCISNPVSLQSKEKFLYICCIIIFYNRDIGPAVRVFADGPGDLGSIPGRVIPKTLKMELDTTLLNTQHYKVRFKGKVEQSREWSSTLPYTLV